jgi:hypothetical protein
MKSGCDHLRVNITAIVRAWNAWTRSRVIGGRCQDCTRDVRRVDGDCPTNWEVV